MLRTKMMQSRGSTLLVLVLGLLVLALTSTAFAQRGTMNSKYATKEAHHNGLSFQPRPDAIYTGADYIAGGVGMRNLIRGGITLSGSSGVSGPMQDALLYWSVLGPVTSADQHPVTVTRRNPGPAISVSVFGDLIATGPDPCWGSTGNWIYRAHLPVTLVNGPGNYEVSFQPAASGLNTGEDPFDGNVVAPLMEGAAIVGITAGSRIVTVFDTQAGLLLFPPSLSYTLNLLVPTIANDDLKFTTIGADGQAGLGLTADRQISFKETFISNFTFPQLAGPTCLTGSLAVCDNDADWNGNSGSPLPQLFDVRTHEFSQPEGGFNSLHVLYTDAADCANVVANVFSQITH